MPQDIVDKYLPVMDIVYRNSICSTCFTKSYGQYVKATGSLINIKDKLSSEDKQEFILRYFTPREVSNLLCFPQTFNFPNSTTRKQQYRMLGNSLNVKVVSYLLHMLLKT